MFYVHSGDTSRVQLKAVVPIRERPTREMLVDLEAQEIFRYLLPAAAPMPPHELLELRERVRDTRQGFGLHLQKLSGGLDAKVRDGEPLNEIAWWARHIVETELIPDYREFSRQLGDRRSGVVGRALDATAKFFEINAAPWTPAFYAGLLKALGAFVLAESAVQTEKHSNRALAHNFMRSVEQGFAEDGC
jgi:hypothetical protein